MGRFGRPVGLKGEIKLYSYTDPIENISNYTPWFISTNNQLTSLQPLHFYSKKHYLVGRLKGYDDRTSIEKLVNQDILIERKSLPPLEKDENYFCDLVGKNVINKEGHSFGNLLEFKHNNAHYLMCIENDDKKITLIPYTKNIVQNIEETFIEVDWDNDEV